MTHPNRFRLRVMHAVVRLLPRLRPGSPIRGVLIAGFAVVFGLWVLSGYELVRRLHAVEERASAEQEAALRAERLLSTIRTNVLLGSIYLRDAIIDNRSVKVDVYQRDLNQIRSEVERLLPPSLAEIASAEERQHWAQLETELAQFWKLREIVLSPSGSLDAREAAAILRRTAVPTRTTVLQIVDRLAELQVLAQRRHEEEISALYGDLQTRLLAIGAVAILIGLLVAILATRFVGRLERQIEDRRAGEQRTRRDLERLSARLVTVQEEERRTLSRELHDEVGQALTAIMVDVTVALRDIEGLRHVEPGARIASWLEDARAITENTLQGVRDLSQLLHPSMLDDFGLPEALRAYLRTFSKRTGIHTQLTEDGMGQRLPQDVEVCIYRIAQEALTNVARHSGARNATVKLSHTEGALDLAIEDDGRGVDRRAPGLYSTSTRGLGVIGMRERAQAVGGTFAFESRQGGGTRVAVHLPLRAQTAADASRSELLAG